MSANNTTPIFYGLVGTLSEDNFIIQSDYPRDHSALTRTCQNLIQRIKKGNQRKCISHEQYSFNIQVREDSIFLCVSGEDTKLRVINTFLENVEERWNSAGRPLQRKQIKSILKDEMDKANKGDTDKIQQAQEQIEDIKGTMLENIDKALKRGEDLDVLLRSTEDVKEAAGEFKKGSLKLKRKMQMRLCMMVCTLIYIVVFIVLVILGAVCGISGGTCWDLFEPKTDNLQAGE
mmetsp:Transcript_10369/g.38456  ORF Transcript_10369/g.38456 Transcript_10369/m.38456 type:complete len:233 (-) Transcript_10369:176-874(-)|eukprot:CAMPEP_0117443396 /NCGR_PEP_ID=MMETSP0759-20121206/4673_1 /TAXON_ID=63605 /ORGANISM="Percolomonas cosmopolitus, Strain WS" /LENGTH=232 /DNA_ID=CAMNT_0005235369 /DNA_START=142 /DNA_END=840 /DNA_ORIENTATION=+